jgi:acetyl-CoA synthetase
VDRHAENGRGNKAAIIFEGEPGDQRTITYRELQRLVTRFASSLLELGLRWQYGIIVFGAFTDKLVGVYTASTAIWLVNLLLPAVIGTFVAAGFGRKRSTLKKSEC